MKLPNWIKSLWPFNKGEEDKPIGNPDEWRIIDQDKFGGTTGRQTGNGVLVRYSDIDGSSMVYVPGANLKESKDGNYWDLN